MTAVLHAAPPADETLGRLALAEEFSNAAVKAVTRPNVAPVPGMIRQSAALLKAACFECDFEPRFPRLLEEACAQLNDSDGQIDALKRYRSIQLPEIQNDQFAQVKLIDLYTQKQETLEKKLDYLQPLLAVKALPDPVKSHIAWVCWKLLTEKFDTQGATAMLAQSLQLNPVNPEALQAQYVAAQATGIPGKRALALVALLKSNPAQPLVMGTLADELAAVGQPDLAVTWYKRSFVLSQQLGVTLDGGRYLNYAAALLAMDQSKACDEAANMLLTSDPSNIGAATIRLLAARAAAKPSTTGAPPADPDALQHAREVALTALSAQMGTLDARLHGIKGAAATQASTTQPADLVGDIAGDAPLVRDIQNRADITTAQTAFCTGYAESLCDLIFYYTYFDPQPANANKLLDSLRLLRPADDVELTRLEGFAFLADGKRDEAKVKFSAIADHDPLAKMGLLLLDPKAPATAADASKLVTDHPAGLLGAILLDGLHDLGAKLPSTTDSTAVADAAASFPVKLFDLLDRAHTAEFYTIVADPLHAAFGFDEPALVRVSIKNVSDFDLSVGTDAAIRQDLMFDVAVQAGNNPTYSSVAYDGIAGPLVLPAHHLDAAGSNQIVRVDKGQLIPFLADHPTLAVSLLYSVFTNPIGQQAGVAPGPGGYRKQFNSPMERNAAPINNPNDVQALINRTVDGRPDQKIHALALLADYVMVLQKKISDAQHPPSPAASDVPAAGGTTGAGSIAPPGGATPPPPPNPQDVQAAIRDSQTIIGNFTSAIRSALRDPSPTVRYWAQAKLAEIADPANRAVTASMMVQGADWQQRVLGLELLDGLPPSQIKAIAKTVQSDPVDYVKNLADATVEIANLPPASQPAAKPDIAAEPAAPAPH